MGQMYAISRRAHNACHTRAYRGPREDLSGKMVTSETHTMCVGPLIAPTGRPVDQDRASRTDKDRCKHQAAVEHADTTPAITAIARRSARRQGLADHRRLLARFRAAVGVALARRSARMVHACLRRPPEQGWQ